MPRRGLAFTVVGLVVAATALFAQATPPPAQTPIPKPAPFPGAQPPATAKPAALTTTPAGAQEDWGAVDPLLAGVPAYPGAEFLESFDAGKGQRLFAFGTNDDYAAVVRFYKAQYKKSGEEVSRTPPIQQFDLGPFDSNTMAQRPSVLVKDYAWPKPTDAYTHVAGITETHFKTLIQIIPVAK